MADVLTISDRDRAIIDAFNSGRTQKEVAAEFGVSRALVGVIWKRAGLKKEKKVYLGTFVSKRAKEIVRLVSLRRSKSVSSVVDKLLIELGQAEGIEV